MKRVRISQVNLKRLCPGRVAKPLQREKSSSGSVEYKEELRVSPSSEAGLVLYLF